MSDNNSINFSLIQGESRRIKLLYLILLIAILVLLPMAAVAFYQGDNILALVDTSSAIFLFFVFLYQKRTRRDNIAISAGILFCALFYIYLFIYGGVSNSAFFWLYTFPLFASFLLGARKGLIVSLATLSVALIYFIITQISNFHVALYSADLMIRFFASLLVVTLFSYVAENNREASFYALGKANEDLEKLTTTLKENNKQLTHEVSQRKKIEANLVQEKQKAETANRIKSEFLANMSHELRTPLNHIIGFTDLVASKKCGPLNSTQNEYLEDVLGSSKHLLSLINDILDLSKVEAGQMTLELNKIELEPFLQQSLTMIKEKALKHQLKLNLEIEDGLTTIEGDKRKLKQVLYNLLANAAKFTPDRGSIAISATMLKADNAKSEAGKSDQEEIKISVRDSGIGLKQEDLEPIFSSFKQVDGSASRQYQGTGLGLALSRNFIDLHQGRIWAESPGPGEGSTLTFTLPSSQPTEKDKQNTKEL